ncbi:PDZ domain-containing protein [Caulobacter sp. 17J80-11]|uniref:PDZ domain-containing protein n=1 Tax=Caulobacter sp. 17J80-11 TaxID=2763502 RepID=UPI0016538F68|nr:PDZ domain-containing protein [Caulobacter sp. 17J80-11]MBC6982167.1 hypothetical protein [Caulobacter sp. 17J80-11]
MGAALAACIALALPSAARAEESWWLCAAIQDAGSGVKVSMGLMGPNFRPTRKATVWAAKFAAPGTTQADDATFEPAYRKYLLAAGYPLTDANVQCGRRQTEAEIAALRVKLGEPEYIGDNRPGAIKVTYDVVDVAWKPEGLAPLAAAGPAPHAAPATATVASLGARFEDLTAQAAELAGLAKPEGAVVMAVDPPATGGLKRLDVVTEIAGQPVARAADVARLTAQMRVGYKAPVVVWRGGKSVELAIAVAAPPTPPAPPAAKPDALAPAVQVAVDKAREAVKLAEAKVAAARESAGRAREIAAQADEAARKAEQKVDGYGVITGRMGKLKFRYAGQIEGGVAAGLGVRTYSNGYVDRGQFVAGDLDGLGVLFLTGDVYSGAFRRGLRAGPGVYEFSVGTRWEGVWAEDALAVGVVTTAPSSSIKSRAGEFSGRQLSGHGIVIGRDGVRREGAFSANALSGPGAVFAADGTLLQQGRWEWDQLVEPMSAGAGEATGTR